MFESLRTHQIKPQGTKSLLPISSRLFCFQFSDPLLPRQRQPGPPGSGVIRRQHHRLGPTAPVSALHGRQRMCLCKNHRVGCLLFAGHRRTTHHVTGPEQCSSRATFFRTMNPSTTLRVFAAVEQQRCRPRNCKQLSCEAAAHWLLDTLCHTSDTAPAWVQRVPFTRYEPAKRTL